MTSFSPSPQPVLRKATTMKSTAVTIFFWAVNLIIFPQALFDYESRDEVGVLKVPIFPNHPIRFESC